MGLGNNHGGQCDVQEWKNVVAAACGYDFSVGLMKNGRVTVAGGSDKLREAAASWTDMVQVVCGPGFAAGLRRDGTVAVAGLGEAEELDERMAREAAAWRDITFWPPGSLIWRACGPTERQRLPATTGSASAVFQGGKISYPLTVAFSIRLVSEKTERQQRLEAIRQASAA